MAECLARCGCAPLFATAVGADAQGASLVAACRELGMDMRAAVPIATHGSPTYLAVLDAAGDLFTTVADMAATEQLTWVHLAPHADALARARIALVDGNVTAETMAAAAEFFATRGIPGTIPCRGYNKLPSLLGMASQVACPFPIWCLSCSTLLLPQSSLSQRRSPSRAAVSPLCAPATCGARRPTSTSYSK